MRNAAVLLTAAAVLAACGSTEVPRHVRGDLFYRGQTLPAEETLQTGGPAEGEVLGYAIELEIRDANLPRPRILQAPRLVVYAGQLANVVVVNQVAFIETFETEVVESAFIADPIVGILQLGLQVEVSAVPSPDGDGRVLLGYHLHSSETPETFPQADFPIGGVAATIQLPAVERALASGVRTVEPGVKSLLAELPEASVGGRVRVYANVVPVGMAGPVPEQADFPEQTDFELDLDDEPRPALDALLASAGRGTAPSGRLDLELLWLLDRVPLGAQLEHLPERELSASLRTMGLVGALVPGARIAGLLEEAYIADYEVKVAGAQQVASPIVEQHRSGLTAEVLDGDRLRVRWTTTPRWIPVEAAMPDGGSATLDRPQTATHEVEVRLTSGTRYVPVAWMAGGGTAALRITFRRDPKVSTGDRMGDLVDRRRTAGR